MAIIVLFTLLFSIGAGLGGWGINQANRWLPDLSLRQRLLIGSLTAPLAWFLFCAFVLAIALSKRSQGFPEHPDFDGPLEALLILLGASWAGGLTRAWLAHRALGSTADGNGHPAKPPMNFFPFIYLGLLPLIGVAAGVQIWRQQGDVPDTMKIALLGAALAMGVLSALLSILGLSRYRVKALPRQIRLRNSHIAAVLIIGPVVLGVVFDLLAGEARVKGVATLFGGTFAVGAGAHFLQFRSAMRARLAKLDGRPLSN